LIIENYSCNWKNQVIHMTYSRIPYHILRYQPKRRSLERPFKRWHETET